MSIGWDDVAIVIRAVLAKRQESLTRLTEQLDGFSLPYFVSDQQPDRTRNESFGDVFMAGYRTGRKYVLQFEDDVILHSQFPRLAMRVFELARNAPLILLHTAKRSGTLPPRQTVGIGRGRQLLTAQAIALRSDIISSSMGYVLDVANKADIAGTMKSGTDNALGDWMKAKGLPWVYAWPSIVQHDLTQRSLLGHYSDLNRGSPSYEWIKDDPDWK